MSEIMGFFQPGKEEQNLSKKNLAIGRVLTILALLVVFLDYFISKNSWAYTGFSLKVVYLCMMFLGVYLVSKRTLVFLLIGTMLFALLLFFLEVVIYP